MPYSLDDMLVVGVASSALFDLSESDTVFRDQGEAAYRDYQEKNIDVLLKPGVAFPFIRRLLSLNRLAEEAPLVEVIILSRNDPETGLRVMRSVAKHGLSITRAVFMQGRSPYEYMGAFNMSLFLSQNSKDVQLALARGFAAGQVIGSPATDPEGTELRIAFDFDGVLADDSSEKIMQREGLSAFQANEVENQEVPLPEGRLSSLLRGINRIQDIEEKKVSEDPSFVRRVHVSMVTARNAPAHERAVRTLQTSGLRVNDAFFLGGVDKSKILQVLRPHIFFDDQLKHVEGAANDVPSVHIPFGVVNCDEKSFGGEDAGGGAE